MKKEELKYINIKLEDIDLELLPFGNFQRMITNYFSSGYGGGGFLIALGIDNKWRNYGLGHCSCYGPLESLKSGRFTKEEMIKIIKEEDYYNFINEEEEKKKIINFINKIK